MLQVTGRTNEAREIIKEREHGEEKNQEGRRGSCQFKVDGSELIDVIAQGID